MPNQWKPNRESTAICCLLYIYSSFCLDFQAPLEDIERWTTFYYWQKKNDKEILRLLLKYHIDTDIYGLGYTKFRVMRKSFGLLGIRQQTYEIEDIQNDMAELRQLYPNAGIRDMKMHLFTRKHKKVTRYILSVRFFYACKLTVVLLLVFGADRALIEDYFNNFEPELKVARLAKKLKRMQFWAAGTNVLWCMDQHDKWKYKFGLCLHVCVDPFSGYLLWLRVWWNNSNPLVICKYYLETVESLGCELMIFLYVSSTAECHIDLPLLTQSDPGTENVRVANAQCLMRQTLDPQLEGHIQHNYKRNKSNIKAEIEWSGLRRRWSPGFETILDRGSLDGIFDIGIPLHA